MFCLFPFILFPFCPTWIPSHLCVIFLTSSPSAHWSCFCSCCCAVLLSVLSGCLLCPALPIIIGHQQDSSPVDPLALPCRNSFLVCTPFPCLFHKLLHSVSSCARSTIQRIVRHCRLCSVRMYFQREGQWEQLKFYRADCFVPISWFPVLFETWLSRKWVLL